MTINWEVNVINFVTIVISFFALVVAIRNRRNTSRENLYNRQLDAFQNIMNCTNELADLCLDWEIEIELNSKTKLEKLKRNILDKSHELARLMQKSAIILPTEIEIKLLQFQKECSQFRKEFLVEQKTALNTDFLDNKIYDLEDSIRHFIGLEKLSRENRRVTKY